MTNLDRLRIKWDHWRESPTFWLIVVTAVVLLAFAFCRPRPTSVPPKEQHSLDSLIITAGQYRAHRDTLVLHETTYVRQSRQDVTRATIAEHAADSLRDLSKRWQEAAIAQGDTVTAWYTVAMVERHEGDSLRAANAELHHAVAADSAALRSVDARADDAERRLRATDDLNARLARDLRQASPPCRIAWVLGCPSRTQTVVIALVGRELVKVATNVQAGKPAFQGVP